MVPASPQSSHRSAERPSGSPPAAAARLSVLVVSADHALWTELAALLTGRPARQFDSAAELIALWPRARPAVVVLDARRALDLEGITTVAEQILTHGGALVPVAAVDVHSPSATVPGRRGALFDELRLPFDPDAAGAVIDRAAEEACARFSLTGGDPGLAAQATPARGRPGIRPATLWAGLAALLAAVAALSWWLSQPAADATHPPAAPATPPPAARMPLLRHGGTGEGAAPAVPAEDVELQLERARASMRDKRYIDPAADNALAHYRAVLDLDPPNGEARQGLDRIAELQLARASASLASRDYAAALRALESARALQPKHPALAALDAQVNARIKDLSAAQVQAALQANAFSRAAALLAQSEKVGTMPADQIAELRQEISRREAGAQVGDLARLAQVRISQDRLIDPPGDSAKFYLEQFRGRGGAAVAEQAALLGESYVKRLAADTRAAIEAGAWTQVDVLTAELRATAGGAPQAELLRRDATKARSQVQAADLQRLAQLVRDRIGARRLLAPEDDSAVHHLRALGAADPRNQALPALREALGAALVEAARTAYAAGDADEARRAEDAARDLGVSPATLAAVEAAAAAATRASAPTLTKALRLQYPPKAAAAGIEGSVDIEFDVRTDGTTENPRVTDATPKGTFDAAALAAIKGARFAPARLPDGTVVPVRSRLRVRFSLDERR